jgi:hypothetical protein
VTGRVSWLALPLAALALAGSPDGEPSPEDEATFRRLEAHMSVAGLRLEDATLESTMRLLGEVDRKDWLKGSRAPFLCYVGPDGTRLGLGFTTIEGSPILRRFELAAPGALLEYLPAQAVPEGDRPVCARVRRLSAETGGRLRLGMTRAEVTSLLGKGTAGSPSRARTPSGSGSSPRDFWDYSGSVTLTLTPAQREILLGAGVSPGDLVVERELRVEFQDGRLLAIRARQLTRG